MFPQVSRASTGGQRVETDTACSGSANGSGGERALAAPAERDVDHGGGRREPGEHEPSLHAVHLGHDGVEVRAEEKREGEIEGDAVPDSGAVGDEKLPERE